MGYPHFNTAKTTAALEMGMNNNDRRKIREEFSQVVNLTASELEKWLHTAESQSVGDSLDGGESTGHESGRRIVALLRTKEGELTDADYQHMRKVIGYVHRHQAQHPEKDVRETPWRYSLMNWGYDPLKR
jgi:hypothetical protein